MKTILLITYFILSVNVYCQTTTYNILDFNKSKTINSNTGFLSFTPYNQDIGYKINKNAAQGIISSSAFWFGGIGNSAQIRICAQTYYNIGKDQFSGPFSSTNQYNSSSYMNKYASSIWNISLSEIQDHIDNFSNSGYLVPQQIENWPAHGDTTLGVSYYLAPFVDVNNNGKYEPSEGDYPQIKGCAATYIITNDDAKTHDSGGSQLGIEIHYMIYQLSENSMHNDVTFIDVKVIKKTNEIIKDFTMGYFIDADIGNSLDDHSGTSPERNAMFFYNADNDDEIGGAAHFGINPPAFGVVCLNDIISSAGQYKTGSGDPFLSYDYWRYMNGVDVNGQSWTDENGNPTPILYPGNPNDPLAYSAISDSLAANDIRGIMNIKIGIIEQGNIISRSYAIVPANSGNNNLDQVNHVFNKIDALQVDYNNNNLVPCDLSLGISENQQKTQSILLFPNPSINKVHLLGLENGEYEVLIVDVLGKMHLETKLHNEKTALDIHALPKGIYLVMIKSENGNSSILKMIKE